MFYAHSTESKDKSDWQVLQQHLTNVGNLAGRYGKAFDAEDLASLAGLLHDLGKYTDEFQRRLCGDFGRVDHATWGAKIACERYGPVGRLLAYAIAGHHAGLANGRDIGERKPLSERLIADLPALLPAWQKELSLPEKGALTPPSTFKARRDRGAFQLAFLARMIFSCLVDADFIDTEAFYVSHEGRRINRGKGPALPQLRTELNQYLTAFKADREINRLRAEILGHVRRQAEIPPGLFSLTVPTGGGKTLASLAFALDHACLHGLDRVIYVIPFTSIVEQNAAVFRKALGPYGDEAVLEHHSAYHDDTAVNGHLF